MEPVDAPPVPRWGLGDWFLGLGLGLVGANIVAAVVLAAQHRHHVTFAVFVASELALWAGWFGIPLRAARRKGSGSAVADYGVRFRGRDLWVGLLVGVAAQLLLVPVLEYPLRHALDKNKGAAADLITDAHGARLVVIVLAVVVVAPLVEELFFRGLLLRSLLRRVPQAWAVGISALLFALLHLEPLQIPGLFAIGVILAVLALRSGRLGPGICAHAAFNAIAVTALALK